MLLFNKIKHNYWKNDDANWYANIFLSYEVLSLSKCYKNSTNTTDLATEISLKWNALCTEEFSRVWTIEKWQHS